MSQINQAKYLPHSHHVHKSNFRFKIGFELWEILTMLTIVLSIASGIIWFNNLRPKSLDNEFLFVEKEKTVLYNKYKAVKSITEVSFTVLPDTMVSEKCYEDISKSYINTLDYDQKLSQLAQTRQEIEISQLHSQSNLNSTLDMSGLKNVQTSFTDYTDKLKMSLDTQYEFTKNVLTLKQDMSDLCQASFSDVSSMSKNISSKLDDLSTFSDNKSIDSWINISQNFLTSLQKISSNDSTLINQDDINSLQKDFINIFTTTPKLESGLKNISESELEMSFRNLEKWELGYVKQNNSLRSKIVIIYD